jgi:glucose/arabinose dehydrogenase
MKLRLNLICYSAVFSLINYGCYSMRKSHGGGQTEIVEQRKINASDIALLPGYSIQPVTSGLTFPTACTFDDAGNLYVIEAGYSYGEVWGEPKLLKIESDGSKKEIARGERNGPWSGITWYQGAFYIAEGGEMEGGRILRITPDGNKTVLVSNLPSVGDHHTNGPVIYDGYLYFGQGTATNSGVVGEDNAKFGWLLRKKDFHDIPCADITLTGQNYESLNVLTETPDDKTKTGAFVPFGSSTSAGQVIKGQLPCTGSVLRIPVTGGPIELVAWGFRNPFGLAISPAGKLFVTDNGYDERGSRPVWGTGDLLWEIKSNTWYGWPDFSAGKAISNDGEFEAPGKDKVKPVLQNYPNTPPKPIAIFGVHSSSDGFDFSTSADFGLVNQAFVAQFGDMAPGSGKVLYPVGYKIVRVDVNNGVVSDFAVNKGKRNGPASWLGKGGLERPVSVSFTKDGSSLYVVDFGIMKTTAQGPQPLMNTGVIWKISRTKP